MTRLRIWITLLALTLLACGAAPTTFDDAAALPEDEAPAVVKARGAMPAAADKTAPPTGSAAVTMPAAAAPVAAAPVVYVLITSGQSNNAGVDTEDVPAGLPDDSIPFWQNSYYYDDGPHRFAPLDVNARGKTFSHEIRTAQRLKEAGLQVAVIKLSQGATYINRWVPDARSGMPGSKFYTEIAEAVAALPEQFPGSTFHYLWLWDQGEAEARSEHQAIVERWAALFFEIQAGIEAVVGQPLDPYVVRTCSTIKGKTFPDLLEGLQASVTRPEHLFDTNRLTFLGDNVHRTGASQNQLAETIAGAILQDIP